MIRAYLGYLSTYLILILYFLTMDFFQSDVQNFPFEGFTLVAIFVAFALYWPFDSVSGKVKEVISFAEERKLASMTPFEKPFERTVSGFPPQADQPMAGRRRVSGCRRCR